MKNLFLAAMAMGSFITFVGCSPNNGGNGAAATAVAEQGETAVAKYNVNMYPMNKVVCNPWDAEPAQTPEYGLKASLFYRSTGQPRYYSAKDYVEKTTASTQTLFFTDLNVPARMFSTGFSTQTSETIKDDQGNLLVEYFGLKFETSLVLGPNDAEGVYELATLADDGVIVQALVQGMWVDVVNSDGDHSVKMGCATRYFDMKSTSEVPLRIYYYQGPRYHIANVLMWRRLSDPANVVKSVECNKMGTKYFYDPSAGSVPLAAYNRILAEGFKPVAKTNFKVPQTVGYNPCVNGLQPTISNFSIMEIENNTVSLQWNTDILATSQVKVTELATGVSTITESDGVVRKYHFMQVTNLKPNTRYKLQALAISQDLGRTFSEEIEFTTEL